MLEQIEELQTYTKTNSIVFRHQEWFNLVQKNHQDIRKLLGGITIRYNIETKDKNGKCSEKTAKRFFDEITEMYPAAKQLQVHGEDKNVPLSQALCSPCVQHSNRRRIKVIPFLISCAANHFGKGSDQLKNLEKICSRLAESWKSSASKKESLTVDISTSVVDFMRIGTLGIDGMSCFRGDHGKTGKHLVGAANDSFVAIIQKQGNPVGRFLGKIDAKNEVMFIHNFYFANGFFEGTAVNAMMACFAQIFGVDEESVVFHDGLPTPTGGVYINDYGVFGFSTKELKDYKPSYTIPAFNL